MSGLNPSPSGQQGALRPAWPKKSLGQNFLVDRRVLRRIIEAADISPTDVVLEIGPGRGLLTGELSARAARVVAVEIDDALASDLKRRFADQPRVEVIAADAREVELDSLVEQGTPYKIVANLPYYAASPIVRRFLEASHKPQLMVVMVQREVAQRMAAEPGDMSLLSVGVQLYGKPRIVTKVPPGSFRPSPKVVSAVIRIDVYPRPALDVDSEERFFALAKAGFSSRRKQIRNSLAHGLSITPKSVEAVLLEAGVDPKRRAETLSLQEWGRLYDAFRLRIPAGGAVR